MINLDRLLAPWVFVLTGIVFNILSAVITHYFIGLNTDEINRIDSEIAGKQVFIDSQWQSRVEVERKKEFFVLLFATPNADLEAGEIIYRDYLRELINVHGLEDFQARLERDDEPRVPLLLDVSNAALQAIIASINSTYFETLELRDTRMPLERANSRLYSIAIFLQLVGLILVLARDLRRS